MLVVRPGGSVGTPNQQAKKQKKNADAEKILNAMLVLYPTDVTYLNELALNKEADQDYDATDDLYWNILILDPYNQDANDYFKDGK